jgi:hypothetical protein
MFARIGTCDLLDKEERDMSSLCKMHVPRLLRLAAVLFLLGGVMAENTAAQESFGAVVGTVTDANTGQSLASTNVFIVGTGLGGLTNSKSATSAMPRRPSTSRWLQGNRPR